MNKPNEIIYEFDGHPDEITRILGLMPTSIWIAGQTLRGPGASPHSVNAWLLKSPLDGSPEIQEQVDALIPVVAPHAERFRAVPDNICPVLSCSVYGYEYMPAIHFTKDQVRFLASIGAEIDVDVYDLTSTQSEDAGNTERV